jgi:chromosome segregation ATPase
MVLGLSACASQKTPATADVAVSRAAVDSATSSDAAELAPAEMQAAREKLMNANQALAAKDYKAAQMWASAAEADAKLAQSKANSAKATTAANQLQDSIRVLREELDRKPIQQ